jgi:hypothetical protein
VDDVWQNIENLSDPLTMDQLRKLADGTVIYVTWDGWTTNMIKTYIFRRQHGDFYAENKAGTRILLDRIGSDQSRDIVRIVVE